MPQFNAGESKTARATMRNPTGKAFDYDGFVYMGTDLAVMAEVSFHLEAGEEKQISFPVTMPSVQGTYPVHVGVFSGGQNIALYRATEDVVITAPVPVTVILRPNGPGYTTQIPVQYPNSGAHWDKVDEETPDENQTYVRSTYASGEKQDLYELSDIPVGPIIINAVTEYIRWYSELGEGSNSPHFFAIRTHDTTYLIVCTLLGKTYYQTYSHSWTLNPYTGQPWTLDEVNALQAGVSLLNNYYFNFRCTQVYVEVTYTPA